MEDFVISQKNRIILLATALMTLVACQTHDKKAKINHGIDPKSAGGNLSSDDQKIKDMVKSSTDCLPLQEIVEQWHSRTGTGFTIYVQDRDLFNGNVDTKAQGVALQDDTAHSQLLVNRTPIFEEQLGGALLDSELVGSLLNVTNQTDCNTIKFGDSSQVYNITHRTSGKNRATPGELSFSTGTESRTYRMVNTTLEITVNSTMDHISNSDKGGTPTLTEHTKFAIMPGSTDGMKIKTTYANLLVKTLVTYPQDLKDAADKQTTAMTGANNAKKTTTRPKTDNFTVPVSVADMILLNESISSGKRQDASSKTAQ
jgi:hypothetical protein